MKKEFLIKIENNTVFVSGKLNQENAEILKEEINNLSEEVKQNLKIDFEKIDFINSAGIGGIISIYKSFCETRKDLFLANMKPHIYSVFKIAGLTKILNISTD